MRPISSSKAKEMCFTRHKSNMTSEEVSIAQLESFEKLREAEEKLTNWIPSSLIDRVYELIHKKESDVHFTSTLPPTVVYSFDSLPLQGRVSDVVVIDDILPKENPMWDYDDDCYCEDSNMTTEDRRIEHFNSRVRTLTWSKDADLGKKFGLINDPAPETATDAIKRIKAGKVTIKTDTDKYAHWFNAIIWRDPSLTEDRDGYNAASKKLQDAAREAEDAILLATDPAGMKAAVDAFSAKTIQ